MYEKGDIYKGTYEGMYCTPCESFWTASQLKDGKCPDCGREVQPAQDAMSWAVAAGLVEGVTETSLAPKGIALRCQLAALLHRLSLDVQL